MFESTTSTPEQSRERVQSTAAVPEQPLVIPIPEEQLSFIPGQPISTREHPSETMESGMSEQPIFMPKPPTASPEQSIKSPSKRAKRALARARGRVREACFPQLSASHLHYRLRFTTDRFANTAPYWQFVIWGHYHTRFKVALWGRNETYAISAVASRTLNLK